MNWERHSKATPMKSSILKIAIVVITGLLITSILFIVINYLQKESTGIKAVNLMYNFDDVYELDSNMSDLAKITTKDIFSEITIDNQDRALNTYLKFKKNPTKVEIIKSTPYYVLYRLKTESLTGNRKFMMTFDTNWLGKIDYIREMEIIDFYPNLD